MGKSLEDVKRELSGRYLGKAGIHGLGIDRAKNAIRIYHSPQSMPGRPEIFKEIEAAARPFKVIPIKDKPSKIT